MPLQRGCSDKAGSPQGDFKIAANDGVFDAIT